MEKANRYNIYTNKLLMPLKKQRGRKTLAESAYQSVIDVVNNFFILWNTL